jgi:hypothetical protein
MKANQLKLMKRHRRSFRLMGFVWALVGSILLVSSIALVLDPTSSITYNGVPTTAKGPKVFAAVFAGSFVVAGVGFLFAPVRWLDKLFLWRQSLWSSIAFWRH